MKRFFLLCLVNLWLIGFTCIQSVGQNNTGKNVIIPDSQDVRTVINVPQTADKSQSGSTVVSVVVVNEISLAQPNKIQSEQNDVNTPTGTIEAGKSDFSLQELQNFVPAVQDQLKNGLIVPQSRSNVLRSEGASYKINDQESVLPLPDSAVRSNPYELKSTLNGAPLSEPKTILKSTAATPNITPYQPSGWDNRIVVSSTTGTSTSASVFWSNQTLYVDWAVVNNGDLATTQTFYTRLSVDGVEKGYWYTSGLAAGYWAYVADHNIGMLTVGSHSIRIDTDVTGVVGESNETDNSYTRSITVYPYVNLTTYLPSGWDNKLVLSTVTGTNTTDSQILDTENIYLDWSIANVSSYSTATTFYIDLYIDGAWKTSWTRAGLNANTYTTQLDYLVGKLPAGSHTFLIRIDIDGFVHEYNEADNDYPRTITVYNKNVLPYLPGGWSNKIVLSTVTGTTTDASAIYNNQDVFADWAVWNNGSAAVTETFHSRLYIDGVQKGYWYTSGLASYYWAYIADHNIGKLATGTHTAQIVTDSDGEVTETNETDNSYSRSFYVGPSYNVLPYQPGGYDDKLVISTVTGTGTSASVFYDTQTLYVDWGCLNNANDDIAGTFYIRLYIDNVSTAAWTKTGLPHNTYTYYLDQPVGPLSAGTHTFKLVVDSDGNVAESDETDNIYTRTITVVNKNLLPYLPSGWDDKIVISTVTGTNTSATSICDNQPIYLDFAPLNNGTAAITETFYVRLSIDGVSRATWTKVGLGPNTYYTILDFSLGTLSAGTHTAKIEVDVTDYVDETSEADNVYTRTFSVSSCKNLTPYQPSTWDNKIVLSTVTGTFTSATTIYDNQPIYLDWAVISNGTNDISETFTVKLYQDGVLKGSWPRTSLATGVYLYYIDFAIGTLAAGNHTFKIVADLENTVPETNEGDNEYSRTIVIQPSSLPAPEVLAATGITQTSFNANWLAVAGATGYYLDVSTSSTFSSFVTGYNNKNVGNVLTSAVTGLTPGIMYYYRVRAYNATSTSLNSGTVALPTIPPAPVATAATSISLLSFNANWSAATGATGYYLDVSTISTFTSFVTGYNNKNVGNVLTSSVTGLTGGTIYYYRIRAYNSSGTSPNSNIIMVGTFPLAPVALPATNITQTSFVANWNTSTGASGYRLDVATDNAFTNFVTGYNDREVGNVLAFTVNGLTTCTYYYFRVRAYGGPSPNSNVIPVKTLCVPTAVLTIGEGTGNASGSVCVPVTATSLSDAMGFQFTIVYDATKLTYSNCANWGGGTNAAAVLITPLAGGKVTFVYNDAAVNITSGKFFDICFTVQSGATGTASVAWSDSPTPREFSNSGGVAIPCTYYDGRVLIQSGWKLSGILAYPHYNVIPTTETPLTSVPVQLFNSSSVLIGTSITDGTGKFTFPGIQNGTYTLRPGVTQPWGGTTAMDITLYKKHIGSAVVLEPIQVLSGDVNGSTTLTSMDLTIIKQRIGAMISSFTVGDYAYLPTSATINNADLALDIKSLCYGDANGSYSIVTGSSKMASDIIARDPDANAIQLGNGDILVPFRISRAMKDLASVTLEINYSSQYSEVRNIEMVANNEDLYYTVNEGVIRIIYSSLHPLDLRDGGHLMTIRLGLKGTVPVEENLLEFSGKGEFGDYNDNVLKDATLLYAGLRSKVVTDLTGESDILVYPNPADEKLFIKNARGLSITLFNMVGEAVKMVKNARDTEEMDVSNLTSGTYLIRVDRQDATVHKLITVFR
jgi:subtilase family serine protease